VTKTKYLQLHDIFYHVIKGVTMYRIVPNNEKTDRKSV